MASPTAPIPGTRTTAARATPPTENRINRRPAFDLRPGDIEHDQGWGFDQLREAPRSRRVHPARLLASGVCDDPVDTRRTQNLSCPDNVFAFEEVVGDLGLPALLGEGQEVDIYCRVGRQA